MFAGANDDAHEEGGWLARVRGWYSGKIRQVIAHPSLLAGAIAGLLALSLGLLATMSSELLSESARPQAQMLIKLAPGAPSCATLDVAQKIPPCSLIAKPSPGSKATWPT